MNDCINSSINLILSILQESTHLITDGIVVIVSLRLPHKKVDDSK
jgi:hypothetical protein